MSNIDQNCEVCEYKLLNNTDDFCYMFKNRVCCCGQFKPVSSDEDKETSL